MEREGKEQGNRSKEREDLYEILGRELERVMCTHRKHLLKGKAHKQACQE